MIRFIIALLLTSSLFSCTQPEKPDAQVTTEDSLNLLAEIPAFTADSLVNVVIEIPAGSRQKWEVNKTTGQVEWEQITPDSFRVINYLPYPANYGFVPQTLVPEATGGDGDPLDIFVLGSSIDRAAVVKVRIIGIIDMLDNNESDAKLLAVNIDDPGLDIHSLTMLEANYPGVSDIIKLWLLNYKGPGQIQILSIKDELEASNYLKKAHSDYLNTQTK